MSEVRDLLVQTAHDVFGREGGDVEAEIEKSGLGAVAEEGDLGDVAAVIRVSAYHAIDGDYADRVMPPLDDERRRLALLRAIQIAGALDRVQELTVTYARERQQFGQPINRFQAVQQELAELAGQVALAGAAVDQAVEEPSGKRVAVAKVVAGEAAGRVAALAHQIHGAIGFTHEHRLHRYTTRLWRWRDEGGTEPAWAENLGDLLARVGGERVWEVTTDG